MRRKTTIDVRSQRGVVTLAIGILLLVLITLMTLYGARVGLVEQRISSNEYRAKIAHGAAEAGRNHAVEFVNANVAVFNTEDDVFLPDGTTVQGWLAAGNNRWGNGVEVDCDPDDDGVITEAETGGYTDAEQIACAAGLDADGAQAVYFYQDPNQGLPQMAMDVFPAGDGNLTDDRVGINADKIDDELRVSYNADLVLCPLNTELVDHDGDSSTPEVPRVPGPPQPVCDADIENARYFAILVRSEGFLIGDASGDATFERLGDQGVTETNEVVVKYDLFGAGPKLPLTVANTFGSGGTFDIVANPNGGPTAFGGGRSGAPFSVWSGGEYTLSGATVTCQRHEFFATSPGENDTHSDTPPNDVYEVCYKCTCPDKQNEQFYYLSSDVKGKGMDIVDNDPNFPDDLFLFTFGIPRDQYNILKELAKKIPGDVDSCGDLTTASSGLYWSEGGCTINQDVGTPHNPALLITEGSFSIQGGSNFFGVIYLFSPPDTAGAPDLDMQGGSQVYGAVVGDSDGQGSGAGGNAIIYDEAVINRVSLSPEIQRVSPLPGTWSDRAAP